MELALTLAGRVFGMAAGDMYSQESRPRYVGFEMYDRKVYVMSVPKRWDASKPQEVSDNATTRAASPLNLSWIPAYHKAT